MKYARGDFAVSIGRLLGIDSLGRKEKRARLEACIVEELPCTGVHVLFVAGAHAAYVVYGLLNYSQKKHCILSHLLDPMFCWHLVAHSIDQLTLSLHGRSPVCLLNTDGLA
jgi:hypothetical protein